MYDTYEYVDPSISSHIYPITTKLAACGGCWCDAQDQPSRYRALTFDIRSGRPAYPGTVFSVRAVERMIPVMMRMYDIYH